MRGCTGWLVGCLLALACLNAWPLHAQTAKGSGTQSADPTTDGAVTDWGLFVFGGPQTKGQGAMRHMDLGAWTIPNADGQHRLRLQIQNNSRDSVLVLVLRNPYLQQLDAVWQTEGAKPIRQQTGIAGGFRQRPVATPLLRLRLPIQPGATGSLDLLLDNGGLRTRSVVSLESPAASQRERRQRTAVLAFYLAGAVFTLLFGFFILAFVRAYIRFSYGFFFASSLGLVVANQGIGYALFWPSAEGWQASAEGVLMNAALLGGLRFIQRFLKPEKQFRWASPFLLALMLGLALFASLWLFAPHWEAGVLAHFQNANDAFILLGLGAMAVLPWVLFAHQKNWEAPALWLSYGVLAGTVGLDKAAALGLGPAGGWGPGLERGLWAGMVILHFGTTVLVLHRMRRVVLNQARAKADLDTARVRLLRGLVLQEESERLRIGSDLHDEAGSRFAALKMQLSGLAYDHGQGAQQQGLEQVIDAVDALSHANRQLAHRMLAVSLDKLGLQDALRAYRQRLLGEGRHVVMIVEEAALQHTDETAERLLYRMVQEVVEGLFPDVPELRMRIENAPGDTPGTGASGALSGNRSGGWKDGASPGREWLLTAEAQEEEQPLPSPDRKGPAYQGLAARAALFSSQRDHAIAWRGGKLHIWLPKRVGQA